MKVVPLLMVLSLNQEYIELKFDNQPKSLEISIPILNVALYFSSVSEKLLNYTEHSEIFIEM